MDPKTDNLLNTVAVIEMAVKTGSISANTLSRSIHWTIGAIDGDQQQGVDRSPPMALLTDLWIATNGIMAVDLGRSLLLEVDSRVRYLIRAPTPISFRLCL